MRMERRLASAVLTILFLLLFWISPRGEVESRLYVVPLEDILIQSGLPDVPVFVLSSDEALVEVRPAEAERVNVLSSARLGMKGALPLYTAPALVPRDILARGGIEVLHRGVRSMIVRAAPEDAYDLDRLGYPVHRIRFMPLSRLRATPDAGPVHDHLCRARPLTRARLDFMSAMSESASADSLRDLIYFLTYDSAEGAYRSRFAARHDLNDDITPELGRRLEAYLEPAGGSVTYQEFEMELAEQFQGQEDHAVNVVGEKPGTKTSARYIICGHFDATASRDDGFDTTWVDTPAPGANDNATGTAAVIECARLLAPLSLDFGVTFALFSAEEDMGTGNLQGSEYYVDLLAETDSIIAVINLDMIGYYEDVRKAEISYGWRSGWLSEELVETAESLYLETEFEGFQRADVRNSDHASFWTAGIPAAMLSERNEEDFPIPIYPYYHSAADTLGNLDMVQVRDNVALVVGYMSRFADIPGDSLSDIVLTPAAVEFDWVGRSAGFPLVAGEYLTANVRALNVGGSMADAKVYMFEVRRGPAGSGTLVHEGPLSLNVVAGGIAEASATWKTRTGMYGDVDYSVSLLPVDDNVESDLTNNGAASSVTISPVTTVIDNLHVYPNPVEDPDGARIAGDIYTSRTGFLARYVVDVFDVTGLRLLTGEGQVETADLDIPFSSLSGDASSLVPGLYVCVVKLNVRDESGVLIETAKFGVVSGRR